MSKLKNFFLEEVEEKPEELGAYDVADDAKETDSLIENVNTENISQEHLISDIYNQNELTDFSKSIFKIEQVMNSLPKEIPNKTKRETVLAVLSTFGLTVEEIIEDGEKRNSVIKAALSVITEENNNIINNNNENIENKKLEIQHLEQENSDRTLIIKDAENKIADEMMRINNLIKFIGGDEL